MAQVANSILHDVKQMVGQEFDDPTYDLDLKVHINSVFSDLNQLGVGPADGFEIADENVLWSAYLEGNKALNLVKTYMYQRVRLLFDPPAAGFHVTALKEQIDKAEFRLLVEMDPPYNQGVVNE